MATGRLPDPNSAPVTAKGDLYTYSTVPAKLAVGSNGETLVADSSASTGLRWQGNFAAGKNRYINGDFRINQRAFTSRTTNGYGHDRWACEFSGTLTYSNETFTPGTAPVAGYEGVNFARMAASGQSSSGNYALLDQKIEDVRTFANQTVTLSFWAKAASGTPKVGVGYIQDFGSGGSAQVTGAMGDVTISTSWARYSVTAVIPSISGKTVGTSSFLRPMLWVSAGSSFSVYTSIGLQNATIDFWGVQIENGSVATPFQTATGTLAGEFAAACRYYWRFNASSYNYFATGANRSTTVNDSCVRFPVTMRSVPSFNTSAANTFMVYQPNTGTIVTCTSLQNDGASNDSFGLTATVASGLTAGNAANLRANNATAWLEFSSEL